MKKITFGPNAVIFKLGDRANHRYRIDGGMVKLSQPDRQMGMEVFTVVKSPTTIGFGAQLLGVCHRETAKSITEVRVCAFSDHLISGSDIVHGVNAEAQVLIDRLESIIYDSVLKRSARLILTMVNSEGEVFGLQRNEMAQVIGAEPESFSRALAKLADKGYIEVDRKKITVVARKHLELIAIGK